LAPEPPTTSFAPKGPTSGEREPARQYKVLYGSRLGSSEGFRPDDLEQALNRLASEGWVLKSTFVLRQPASAPSDPPGEELVVVLER
jgi:hypothetical protein